MALIECDECGKDVSDKASACPHCGNPIVTPEEEYICCPKCYSKDVEAFQSGFSGKKAFAGAVLTGGIGLLAGTIGSKDIMLGCKSCGNRFKAGEGRILKIGKEHDETDVRILEISKHSMLAAVKFYKEETGCSLSEAKKYVDNLVGVKSPESNSGCAAVLLLIVTVISLIAFL